jgi:rhodanese-related sulfurtransferase
VAGTGATAVAGIRCDEGMTDTTSGPTAPASPDLAAAPDLAAVEHFAARLRFETDPSDVHAALQAGERFSFVDVRSIESWDQGHAAQAVHLPRAAIAERASEVLPLDVPVVVYCWSPACNGGTKAALALAERGYRVREMIGGFEYWAREGFDVEDRNGPLPAVVDPLVMPVAEGCGC